MYIILAAIIRIMLVKSRSDGHCRRALYRSRICLAIHWLAQQSANDVHPHADLKYDDIFIVL